jgi:GT2 family glycosyltransferase
MLAVMSTDPGPELTVLVVNWNSGGLLQACLDGLKAQDWRHFRVVVVDNASSDGSADRLAAGSLDITVLRAPVNLGFAGGNNFGLSHGQPGEWVLLLNPDTRPDPRCLSVLMCAAQRYPTIDAFGARLMRIAPGQQGRAEGDGISSVVASFDTDELDGLGDAYHASGRCWRIGHRESWRPSTALAETEAIEVFSASGAAALYRTSALRALGGFDEDYFCYVEDVDLGFRLRLAGGCAACVPAAVVYHHGSAITGERSAFSVYHGHRNLVWTFVKNMPGALFWLLLPLHLMLNLASIAALALRGQAGVAWRAKRDACLGLPVAWRKRQAIQAARRASLWQIARVLRWGWPGP